jgi:hypothetical protein
MMPCFFAVHDARQAGVAVPVDVVARVARSSPPGQGVCRNASTTGPS